MMLCAARELLLPENPRERGTHSSNGTHRTRIEWLVALQVRRAPEYVDDVVLADAAALALEILTELL